MCANRRSGKWPPTPRASGASTGWRSRPARWDLPPSASSTRTAPSTADALPAPIVPLAASWLAADSRWSPAAERFAEAEAAFSRVERASVQVTAEYNLGNARFMQGDFPGAIAAYEEALRIAEILARDESNFLARLDVVSREEFDAQTEILARTRARVEELEATLASLTSELEALASD